MSSLLILHLIKQVTYMHVPPPLAQSDERRAGVVCVSEDQVYTARRTVPAGGVPRGQTVYRLPQLERLRWTDASLCS